MRSVIIFVLAALTVLAQSVPPGGGKVAAVVGPRGSGAPSMGCSAGMLYMRPGTGLYVCTTTDTWALLAAGAGSGDVVGPAASVDGEAAVYDGITGKAIKRFSGSGIGIFTAGVPSVSSALQWNATTGVGLIKPLTLGQFAGDIGTLNLNGTSARVQILPAAATAEWTLTLPANDGDSGQVLQTNGSGVTSWAAAGAGDVAGPASSVDSELAIFSGTGGKTLKRAAGTGIAYQTAGVLSALAVTDDALPVANGTGVDLKVLPSCSDATTSKLLYNSTTNAFSCGTDQTSAGGGITSLGGLTGGTQTFGNDTNVTMVSSGTAHTLTWSGTLAKNRQNSATVYNDAANTWSTGAQDMGSATSFKVPTSAGAAPTASGLIAYDSTANQFKGGVNAANRIFLTSDSSGNTTLPGTLTVPGTGASNFTAIASPAGTPAAGTGDFYLDSTTKRLATKDDAGTVVNYVGATGNIATATALAANGANCTGQVALGVNASGACEGTATPTLGTAGSVVGTLAFANATSGSITLSPVTGALGTVTLSLPATTGTVALTADPVFTGSTQIPNGTGPTVDAAGELAVDTTTDQFQFYGGAKRALPSIKHVSFVMPAPVATDDFILMKAPYGMTILTIKGVLAGTTNVVGQLQECDSSGASCADLDSDITFNGGEDADDGTLTDSTITSGNWIAWKTTSISGTPTFLTVTVTYRVIPD
jgi:hypothetical protein